MLSGVVSGLQWESGQFSQEMGNSSEVNHQPAISMMLCILRQYVHTLKPSHLKCAIFFLYIHVLFNHHNKQFWNIYVSPEANHYQLPLPPPLSHPGKQLSALCLSGFAYL